MPATPASRLPSCKFWLCLLAAVVIAGIAGAAWYFYPTLKQTAKFGSGVTAKTLCSGVFVSRRAPEAVRADDLIRQDWRLRLFQWNVDRDAKHVTASAFGIGRQTAIFRDGLGCTVVDTTEDALRAQSAGLPPLAPVSDPEALWPEGERVDLEAIPSNVDRAALKAAVDAAFTEPDEKHPRGTRALVVVYDGRIVAERYAPGFDAKTPLLGWSMAKTAINTLVGLRVKDGKLAIADRDLLREWREKGDQRRRDITLDQLLHMTSGLAFGEDYVNGDAGRMLFIEGDSQGTQRKGLSRIFRAPTGIIRAARPTSSPAFCVTLLPTMTSRAICDTRGNGCLSRSACIARFSSQMPRAFSSALPTSTPQGAIGRGLASCICKMVCGRDGVCYPKLGSPIAWCRYPRRLRGAMVRRYGLSSTKDLPPNCQTLANRLFQRTPSTCWATMAKRSQSCRRAIS